MSHAPQDEESPTRYVLLKEEPSLKPKKHPNVIEFNPYCKCAVVPDKVLAKEAEQRSECFHRHVGMKDPDAPFGITMLCWTILCILSGLIILAIMLPPAYAENARREAAVMETQKYYVHVEELAATFNASEFAETVRNRAEKVDDFLMDRLKRSFVNYMLITPREYVCVPTYPNLDAVYTFSETLLPHFQLSHTLSSASEICFVPLTTPTPNHDAHASR